MKIEALEKQRKATKHESTDNLQQFPSCSIPDYPREELNNARLKLLEKHLAHLVHQSKPAVAVRNESESTYYQSKS